MPGTSRLRTRASLALLLIASLSVLGFIVTLDRAPRTWADEVIYASVARSIEQRGSGVPSLLEDPSAAVDHERLYGPVFFRLAAASFRLTGFSVTSFRAVSLAAALMAGLATVLMVHVLGGDRLQQSWAFTLLLLTPELGSGATNGRMDALAVGLGLTGLMLFLRALVRDSTRTAAGSGLGLALAALTTPRAFPFVGAFFLAGCVLVWRRRQASHSRHFAVAGVMLAAIVGTWATWTYGNPLAWARKIVEITANTPIEGGSLVSNGTRAWEVSPWTIWTTAFSLIAAAMATRVLVFENSRGERIGEATRFALTVSIINTALCFALVNFTFAFSIYFAVPLLATTLAIPGTPLDVRRLRSLRLQPLAAVLCGTFLVGCGSIRLVKYLGVAATWSARNPDALRDFVASHVPRGSEVWGPPQFGFYAVERAGSSYRSLPQVSWADWARQVPRASFVAVRDHDHAHQSRFIMWPGHDSPPVSSTCLSQLESAIFVFEPDDTHLGLLGPLAPLMGEAGYPQTALYRMPLGCP